MSSLPINLYSQSGWLQKNLVAIVATVAFLFMSALAFEQGQVIENQRLFIHQIFGDSMALNALRASITIERQQQQKHAPQPAAKP